MAISPTNNSEQETTDHVGACLVALAASFPNKKETGPKKTGPKCNMACTQEYSPICAGDGHNKPLSFGNVCVLEKYNCEHSTRFSVGPCVEGVRVSAPQDLSGMKIGILNSGLMRHGNEA
ncbi:hypothetical protein AAG570_013039 [Ranatra chinensis]|uniref:Kazal-like domain-containing protein n=1 Tax=Ranatra chinensis TaxID=642074 RepID=A0ABD0YFP0_9HEMI